MNNKVLVFFFLAIFFSRCKHKNERIEVFRLFYSNNIDGFITHLDGATDSEMDFIVKNKLLLKNEYEYSIKNEGLVSRLKTSITSKPDTIRVVWNEDNNKINLGSYDLIKLYRHENEVRESLAIYNVKLKRYSRALSWLTYGDTVKVDYLLGDIYFKMDSLSKALPYLERAYSNGHDPSGISLSFIYSLFVGRDKSMALLKDMAKRNNSDAMVRLGEYYDTYFSDFGYDPPKDAKPHSSFQWYKKAAELNNASAMHRLGYIYEAGINKEMNIDSAFYWYKKSSELGESISSARVAQFYLEGEYLVKNLDSGMVWMQKAIDQDPASGYFELGKIYELGIGVQLDGELALKYYIKADSLGDPVAHIKIKKIKSKLKLTFLLDIKRRVFSG